MWRKYRDRVTKKFLKRIRGRKTSIIYQNQILSVNEIFTYTKQKKIFYYFYVQGNLPQVQKNKRRTQFLAIRLSKGSTMLMVKIIREVLKRKETKRFFFMQYPVYPQFNINELLLLIHVQDENKLQQYEFELLDFHEEFEQALDSLVGTVFKKPVD